MIYKPKLKKTKYYIAEENTTKLKTSTEKKIVKQNHQDILTDMMIERESLIRGQYINVDIHNLLPHTVFSSTWNK